VAELVGETDTRLWRMLFRQVDAAYAQADFSNVCCVLDGCTGCGRRCCNCGAADQAQRLVIKFGESLPIKPKATVLSQRRLQEPSRCIAGRLFFSRNELPPTRSSDMYVARRLSNHAESSFKGKPSSCEGGFSYLWVFNRAFVTVPMSFNAERGTSFSSLPIRVQPTRAAPVETARHDSHVCLSPFQENLRTGFAKCVLVPWIGFLTHTHQSTVAEVW